MSCWELGVENCVLRTRNREQGIEDWKLKVETWKFGVRAWKFGTDNLELGVRS